MNPQTAVINDDVNGTPRELLPVLTKIRKDMRKAAGTLDAREARYLVDLYYQMQENRLRAAGQIRAIQKSETEEPHETLSWFLGQAEILEASIKMALGEFAESRAVGRWSLSICGIGPVIASGLIAHISMNIWRCATSATNRCRPEAPCSAACRHEPTQTASRIWRYAGLDPSSTWEKGQKRPWNAALKVLCWKAGQSFVKVSNLEKDFYGKLYQQRKRLETERNEAGAFADQAAAVLAAKRIGKETDAYKAYSIGKLPKAHIQQRAERYAVKIFLSHWHQVAYFETFGKQAPKPYVIAHLGHADEIQVPNWPF